MQLRLYHLHKNHHNIKKQETAGSPTFFELKSTTKICMQN